jgi:hypothetical protein
MSKTVYRKFSREDQRALAVWAAECAGRVLTMFENVCPKDERPRAALAACRAWVRTGVFSMDVIRKASLGAHAAARGVIENDAACFAARAAGQAVATAHVTQHAYGGALYALKAIAAAHPASAEAKVAKQLNWQSRRLPEHLREEIMSRIVVVKNRRGVKIKIDKSEGF